MTVLTTEKRVDSSIQKTIQTEAVQIAYKKKSLWKAIAKNEIRIRSSSFRNHRKIYFLTLYFSLFLWAFIGAPFLFDMFMPTLEAQYSSIFKSVVALLIEAFMMTLFLVLVMYPLNNVYRESEIGFKESLLATPVRANDIFLGEFLGKFPIYTMAVLIFAPIIVGLINPIIDLTLFQYLIIYICVFGLVYFANLIGSIIASWLEHKISKSEKARDLGKALIWIFTIALIAIMYTLIFFLNELMAHPELKNWLVVYPSLWFSNIILYSIDPILLNTFVLNIWFNIILAIGVPLITLYLSYKKAESFYTLERGKEKISISIVNKENPIYFILRKTTGRKWGGLIIMQLKRFFRKKANMARIAYVIGLLGFMSWFLSRMGDNPVGRTLVTTMIVALGGGVGSVMLGHLGFVDSKDVIWVYKRSPRGIKAIIYSYLSAIFILNIFISIFMTILFSVFASLDIINALIFFAAFLLFTQISMAQAMGLQCISPAFGEKDSNMKVNSMISMLLMQPLMFLPIVSLIFIRPKTVELLIIIMHGMVFLYNIGVSLPLLYFGTKKLKKLE